MRSFQQTKSEISNTEARFNPGSIYEATIMDNRDPSFSGTLKVFIPGAGFDPDDTKNWIIAHYAPPFYGTTPDDNRSPDHYQATKKSYGMFFVPPDVGNQVLVLFAQGSGQRCFWFACVQEHGMNHMIPGIPEGKAIPLPGTGNEPALTPVTEFNRSVQESKETIRPQHVPLTNGLLKQGLLTDRLRGAGSSGARRSSPAKVQGFLTPGGTQVIFDDGYIDKDVSLKSWADDPLKRRPDDNQNGSAADDQDVGSRQDALIRIRTRSGAQILISETEGHIYMNTRDGQSWFELNNEGFIDGYAARSVSFRAEKDINLRADGNVNIEAIQTVNIKGANINLQAGQSISFSAGTNISGAAGSNIGFSAGSDYAVSGGTVGLCSSGLLHIEASGSIGITSGADILESASGQLHLNGPVLSEGPSPVQPTKPTGRQILDKQVTGVGSYRSLNRSSITSRTPSHEPWPDHHATSVGLRGAVEESNEVLSDGMIDKNQDKPLPVCGSPRAGMDQGKYEGVGYSSDNQPLYEKTGSGANMKSASEYVTDSAGLSMIRQHEGIRNKAYNDVAGLKTIGVGHLLTKDELSSGVINLPSGAVHWEQGLSNAQVDELLAQDVRPAEQAVRSSVTVPLTQEQFNSLVSFTFNVGTGALKKSTMLKELNAGNYGKVAPEFMRWNKAGGKEVPGLTSRRQQEALAFSGAENCSETV